jgi:hypothetical protein
MNDMDLSNENNTNIISKDKNDMNEVNISNSNISQSELDADASSINNKNDFNVDLSNDGDKKKEYSN